jgi:hypothetical protein
MPSLGLLAGTPIVPGGGPEGGGAGVLPPGPGPVPGGAPGAAPGGAPGVSALTVRVYNNSMIIGLAQRAANELRLRGWNVVEVGNYPYGVIPESTVYFRSGTEEEGAARSLAAQFGVRVLPRFEGIQHASPGLIVIATSNWGANAS